MPASPIPLSPLCQLPAGSTGRVCELTGDDSFCQRVREMGFGEAALVTKISGSSTSLCLVNGTRIATIGVVQYRSLASAKAGSNVQRDGRSDPLVIRPLAIEFVAKDGQGARQRVAISASDAAALRKSGMLSQPSRIVTVWKSNIRSD